MTELNAASIDEFTRAVSLLFEPAPRFAGWLAAARPFVSDAEMLRVAARIAHRMTDADKVQLVNAHPRLGARTRLSRASRREQGTTDAVVDRELKRLNTRYERRFGFRYLVRVGGRPRADLLPDFRAALTNDREAELRRALDDTLAIAADRLHFLRSPTGDAA